MYHQTSQTPEKIDKEREMQLNIKEVKIGKTGTTKKGVKWTQYMVLFEDGQKASTFDNKIACLGGQTIDVELEQDGNYTNIKSWSATSDAPTPAPTTTAITAIQPSKEASIEAQVAVKEIGEALRAKIEVKPEYQALYWGWIGHALAGILPPVTKQAPSAKLKHPQPVKEEEPPLDESDSIPF
jgi:hypothetical protein